MCQSVVQSIEMENWVRFGGCDDVDEGMSADLEEVPLREIDAEDEDLEM